MNLLIGKEKTILDGRKIRIPRRMRRNIPICRDSRRPLVVRSADFSDDRQYVRIFFPGMDKYEEARNGGFEYREIDYNRALKLDKETIEFLGLKNRDFVDIIGNFNYIEIWKHGDLNVSNADYSRVVDEWFRRNWNPCRVQ